MKNLISLFCLIKKIFQSQTFENVNPRPSPRCLINNFLHFFILTENYVYNMGEVMIYYGVPQLSFVFSCATESFNYEFYLTSETKFVRMGEYDKIPICKYLSLMSGNINTSNRLL